MVNVFEMKWVDKAIKRIMDDYEVSYRVAKRLWKDNMRDSTALLLFPLALIMLFIAVGAQVIKDEQENIANAIATKVEDKIKFNRAIEEHVALAKESFLKMESCCEDYGQLVLNELCKNNPEHKCCEKEK